MNKARLLAMIAVAALAVPSTAAATTAGGGPHVRVFDGVVGDAPAVTSSRHDTTKNSIGNIR